MLVIFLMVFIHAQGYFVVCLEERMKYLRRPNKRSQMACDETPPAKRPVKPLKPQVVPVGLDSVGEDDASHARNTKMLQELFAQVLICNHTYLYNKIRFSPVHAHHFVYKYT